MSFKDITNHKKKKALKKEATNKGSKTDKKKVIAPVEKKVSVKEPAAAAKKSKLGRKKKEVTRSKKIVVHSEIHENVKFNNKEMAIGEYIEALILLDRNDYVNWVGFKPPKLPQDDKPMMNIFILPTYHSKAKYNLRRMQLAKYIHALVSLDLKGKIEWKNFDKLELE